MPFIEVHEVNYGDKAAVTVNSEHIAIIMDTSDADLFGGSTRETREPRYMDANSAIQFSNGKLLVLFESYSQLRRLMRIDI